MNDAYPSNSQRAASQAVPAEEPRQVKQVTTAEVTKKRTPLGKKFRRTFISGDAKTTAGYVASNVLLPQLRDMLNDAISQTASRMIYGDSPGPRRGPTGGRSILGGAPGSTNYNAMARGVPTQQPPRNMSVAGRRNHDFGEIQIPSHAEATSVLEGLYDLYNKYDYATVADLYTMTGIPSNAMDRKWGWTSLQGTRPQRTRSGMYILGLPEPEYLGD